MVMFILERQLIFRENNDASKDYRKEGACFIGRILHDLVNCETGFIINSIQLFLIFIFLKDKVIL
jgi:hypothetical protein